MKKVIRIGEPPVRVEMDENPYSDIPARIQAWYAMGMQFNSLWQAPRTGPVDYRKYVDHCLPE